MPYLNIDDGIDEHPKVEALSDAAYRQWKTSLSYCSRNQTDGVITLARSRLLTSTGTDVTAAELVAAGLWHDLGKGCENGECVDAKTCRAVGVKGSYLVHDYLQWNHSKAWWEKRRAGEAERLRKYRSRKKGEVADGT